MPKQGDAFCNEFFGLKAETMVIIKLSKVEFRNCVYSLGLDTGSTLGKMEIKLLFYFAQVINLRKNRILYKQEYTGRII